MDINQKPNKAKTNKFFKGLILFFAFLAVFSLGVGLGEGRFSITKPSLDSKLDFNGVNNLYRQLTDRYDGKIDISELQEGLKEGLIRAVGDPNTEYLDQEQAKELDEQLIGSFEGIGAELSKEEQSVVIIAPIDGFPAKRAGLRAGDIIAEINGESAFDISLSEAVQRIRGPRGTDVKLGIVRNGERLNFTITRDTVTIPSVETEIKNGNIGYLKVSRFGEDTAGDARQAAQEFLDKDVNGIVLDLRSNPGGLLDAGLELANLWLEPGQAIMQERRDGQLKQTFYASDPTPLKGITTVVLIDGGSASASEIVAGALKDNLGSTLIGQKTFGKGSVQEIVDLSGGGVLKVTVAHWATPSGHSIENRGIKPDRAIKLSDEDIEQDKDPQLDAALRQLR